MEGVTEREGKGVKGKRAYREDIRAGNEVGRNKGQKRNGNNEKETKRSERELEKDK